jgi:hypothetical protein
MGDQMFELQTTDVKYLVPRSEGWEDILEGLVRKITGVKQGRVRGGTDYKNDVFEMKTYKFGICHCTYGKKYSEFEERNQHALECFHTEWQAIQDAFRNHPKYGKALILRTERVNMEVQLCRKYRIPFNGGKGLELVCTCDFKNKWKSLNINHDETCEHVMPNFWHKPSGFKIWWYKNFFRDSYSTERICEVGFEKIIKECIKSV